LAAQLEESLAESAELIQSSGGVFEIEDRHVLIFSKKALNRFPEEGEIIRIARAIDAGMDVAKAQEEAAANAPKPPTFGDWFEKLLGRGQ
jgi:predicted Rdx family selenoprotein